MPAVLGPLAQGVTRRELSIGSGREMAVEGSLHAAWWRTRVVLKKPFTTFKRAFMLAMLLETKGLTDLQ